MVRIAAASGARRSQTPNPWKIRRLALPSAVVRSSKLGWLFDPGAVPSASRVETPVPANPTARLAPTMPPPMMATSTRVSVIGSLNEHRKSAAPAHQRFDGFHGFRRLRSQHLDTRPGHHHVVLDPHANVMHPFRDAA